MGGWGGRVDSLYDSTVGLPKTIKDYPPTGLLFMDSIEMVLTLLDDKARVFKLHDFREREREGEKNYCLTPCEPLLYVGMKSDYDLERLQP